MPATLFPGHEFALRRAPLQRGPGSGELAAEPGECSGLLPVVENEPAVLPCSTPPCVCVWCVLVCDHIRQKRLKENPIGEVEERSTLAQLDLHGDPPAVYGSPGVQWRSLGSCWTEVAVAGQLVLQGQEF